MIGNIFKHDQLPKGWVPTTIGNLLDFQYGKGLTKKKRNENGKFPVFGSNGIVGYHDNFLIEAPALIIGRKGAAGEVSYSDKNCWPIDTTYFIIKLRYLNIKFVFYLLKSLRLNQYDRSTAIPGLNRNDAYGLSFNLPPLPEQHRIADKIEELFSELDNGIENLKKAREQLKTYRQAVLKYAFEGGYSSQNENCETVSINGIESRIPKTWSFSKLGEYAKLQGGFAFKSAEYKETGIPIVKIKNVHYQHIDWSDKTYVDASREKEFFAYSLNEGDVLIAMTRPVIKSLNTVKTVVVKKGDLPALLNQRVGRFMVSDELDKDYLKYFIFTDFFKRKILKESSSSQQPNISSKKIENFDFVLPPTIKEQRQIAQEIESRLSVCDKLEQTIEDSLKKAEALRQSILKKAFEGELTKDWRKKHPELISGENSAEKLLERIKAEKEKNRKDSPQRRKEKRKKSGRF